jgi:hypothetical protein
MINFLTEFLKLCQGILQFILTGNILKKEYLLFSKVPPQYLSLRLYLSTIGGILETK